MDSTVSTVHPMPFVVNETPYCIWESDLPALNVAFLKGIDTNYFERLADIYAGALSTDDSHVPAIALRAAYVHSLETLFSLLGALAQAPLCPVGWLLRYRPHELVQVTKKIHAREPLLSRHRGDRLSWDALAGTIMKAVVADRETALAGGKAFARLWSLLARDFLDSDVRDEYNSIKHGMRVTPGGSTFSIGLEKVPGERAAAEDMRVLASSQFGSSFPVITAVETPRQNRNLNFAIGHASRNWDPAAIIYALQVVAASIGNVVCYLRLVNGEKGLSATVSMPVKEDFDYHLLRSLTRSSFGFMPVIEIPESEVATSQEILDTYTVE